MNIVDGKPLGFFGKRDDQFVNDRIRNLREKRNNIQDKIYELSNQLSQLKEENDSIQNEIDNEFLKQERAFDLVGKYIQCANKIYFVTDVERLFEGVRILSNWYCYPEDKLAILLISLDDQPASVRESVAKDSIAWNVVTDSAGQAMQLIDLYNVSALPRCFLIDEEKRIIMKTDNEVEIRQTLEKLIEE